MSILVPNIFSNRHNRLEWATIRALYGAVLQRSRHRVPGNLHVLAFEATVYLAACLPVAFVAGIDRGQRQRLWARFVPGARLADDVR